MVMPSTEIINSGGRIGFVKDGIFICRHTEFESSVGYPVKLSSRQSETQV